MLIFVQSICYVITGVDTKTSVDVTAVLISQHLYPKEHKPDIQTWCF